MLVASCTHTRPIPTLPIFHYTDNLLTTYSRRLPHQNASTDSLASFGNDQTFQNFLAQNSGLGYSFLPPNDSSLYTFFAVYPKL